MTSLTLMLEVLIFLCAPLWLSFVFCQTQIDRDDKLASHYV
jgi:hypothetical protein